MAYTAFISKSAPGNEVHNARKFSEDHPEPDYLLPPALRQRNIHIKTDLTADQVQDEYLTTTRFGKKHGRRHHKAKPIREAVIVCKMDTTENQVRMLMIALEDSLGVRPMYAHVHKDEGHIDEDTGKVKYNPHIHLGYTNLVNGELTHMNQRRMRRAQDICAAVLGMERAKTYKARKEDGEIDKNPKHKDHQTYRAQKRAEVKAGKAAKVAADEDATKRINAEKKAETAETEKAKLFEVNRELREKLKASGIAKQKDYQVLKQIKDSDLSLDEKLDKMGEHVDKVYARVEETTAEETPVEETPAEPRSPATPERGVATTLGVPRRQQQASPAPASTPAPLPAPVVPLFADVLRDWRRQEREKREEAVKEAVKEAVEKARDEEKQQAKDDLKELDEKYVKEYNKLQEDLGFWKKATIEARDLVKTLSRFILALDKGFKTAWPRRDIAEFARDLEPDAWFKDTEIVTFSKKLNDKVDYFNAASMKPKTQVRQTPTPTKALDDDEQDL